MVGSQKLRHVQYDAYGKVEMEAHGQEYDLCSRVIWDRYGNQIKIGVLNATTRDSSWWCDIYKVCFEPEEGSYWFDRVLRHKIGCPYLTWFWKKTWCGDIPLKARCRKLFHLFVQKKQSYFRDGRVDEWKVVLDI